MKPAPSHRVVADRFFREQWKRKQMLRARIDEIWEQDWKGPVSGHSDRRSKFVTDYRAALEAADGFDFTVSGDVSRTRLSATHTFKLFANLLVPVSIGQRQGEDSGYYVEEMAMLTRAGVQLSGKKVVVHQAPLCLLFSRHFLERLFDRGVIGVDLGAELRGDTSDMTRKLAFALSVGLVKTDFSDERGQSAFVPYRDGLIIFVSKILAGQTFDENLGWRFDFVRGKYQRLYLKSDLINDMARTAEARAEDKMFVQSWYAATYVSGQMLSKAQRQYGSDFDAVYDAVSSADIDDCFDLWFNPDFAVRRDKPKGFELTPALARAFDQVEGSLSDDALKVHGKHPIMFLLPDGTDDKALNSAQK